MFDTDCHDSFAYTIQCRCNQTIAKMIVQLFGPESLSDNKWAIKWWDPDLAAAFEEIFTEYEDREDWSWLIEELTD